MHFEVKHKPSYSLLEVQLSPGETIRAEAGAMVYMDNNISVNTKIVGGFFSALAKKILGGESLFVNEFTAEEKAAKIGLAPSLAGDVLEKKLSDSTIMMQAGAFLCSSPDINIKAKMGGLKTLFGGEGLFLLEASGTGDIVMSSYGAIIPIEVKGTYIVDTGHLVAFEPSLEYTIRKVGSWKSTMLSGEGFVFEFSGNGTVWLQSRVPAGFISWLTKLIGR